MKPEWKNQKKVYFQIVDILFIYYLYLCFINARIIKLTNIKELYLCLNYDYPIQFNY